MRLQAADDDAFGSSLIQSNPAITQDSRAPHHPMSFDKKLKLISLRQAHGNAAATNPQKSVVGLESLAARTTEETSRLSCMPTAGHNTNGDDDSSCESLEITQGIRIMGFTGQDCFSPVSQIKEIYYKFFFLPSPNLNGSETTKFD
jgi:hypothetical protein